MPVLRRVLLLLTCGLSLAACAPAADPTDVLSTRARAKLDPDVLAALLAGAPQALLLVVADEAAPIAPDGPRTATSLPSWPGAKAGVEDRARDLGLALELAWDQLPIIPVTVPSIDELAPLLDDPRVVSASPDRLHTTFDAQSLALIGQPASVAAGRTGAGTTVAVLDTGVDFTRAPFGCTAPGVPAACKVAVARDFARDDGARDPSGHGTNVAGIVLAVAPGARVLGLDVFDGATASSSTILSAYNWVLQNRVAYNVAAINLSLGGNRATAPCPGDALAVAFQTGRNAGVVTTVASGNDGALDATAWPACAPAAVSVGAVYDAAVGALTYSRCADPVTAADRVACFSNTAPFLTLLAPGALIDAAGYRMAGTSQAAPHVAGAVAVLRAALPGETASQLVTRLTSSGRATTDVRTGRTTPRLDLARALGLPAVDRTAPVVTASATSAGARVTLRWSATDASGIDSYRLVVALGATPPAPGCTVGSSLVAGAATSYVHGPLGVGAQWSYRVCATDRAGNTAAGVAMTVIVR